MLSLEKLPAVKEGIYDVYGKKVQPERTGLSHYKTAFSSQSDILYHLRGQRPHKGSMALSKGLALGGEGLRARAVDARPGGPLSCFKFSF